MSINRTILGANRIRIHTGMIARNTLTPITRIFTTGIDTDRAGEPAILESPAIPSLLFLCASDHSLAPRAEKSMEASVLPRPICPREFSSIQCHDGFRQRDSIICMVCHVNRRSGH